MAGGTDGLLPIYFDVDHRLFICTGCGIGVNGEIESVKAHLTGKHKEVGEAKKEAIVTAFKETPGALKREDVERIKAITEAGKAIGHLPLLRGCACEGHPGCRFITQTKDEAQRHLRDQHGGAGRIREHVPMQFIFWKTAAGLARFFRVDALPDGGEEDDRLDRGDRGDDMAKVIKVLTDYERRSEARRAVWTNDIDRRELSLWDRRAGWHQQFVGVDMVVHNARTTLPREGVDPPRWRKVLLPAVAKLMQRCHRNAKSRSVYVRRLFRSADNNTSVLEWEPLHIVEPATLHKYTTTWQALMCYLLRVVEMSDGQSRIQWRGEVRHQVREVARVLQTDTGEDEVAELVREVFVALIKAKVGSNASLSPVINFVGAWSFKAKAKVWKAANEVTPMLSQLVYGWRIVGMEDALPRDEDGDAEEVDVHAVARQYVDRYLRDGSSTVFTELFSLKLYGKKRAAEFYARPTINWTADASILYHDGIPLPVDSLRRWMTTLLKQARMIMCEKLVLQPPEWLDRCRDPGLMYDQMTWSNCGESFRHFPRNRLENKWQKLLHRMRDDKVTKGVWETLRCLAGVPNTRPQTAMISDYLEEVESFLERLCVACLMTGGLPPRGTELTSWKYANGQSTMRNFYIVGGRLATVSDYNKTDAVLGSPKLVVRFLPREVAQLYVAFVVDVLPVVQLIQAALMRKGGETRVMSPFLFEVEGVVWDTDKVSRLMAKHSKDSLELTLGVAKWREIAIAIDKKLVRSKEEGGPTGAVHAMQAGHSEETERHHYALTVGMLQGVNDETISAFQRISDKWDAWWRGAPSPPGSEGERDATAGMTERLLQSFDSLERGVVRLMDSVRVHNENPDPLRPQESPKQVLDFAGPWKLADVCPTRSVHAKDVAVAVETQPESTRKRRRESDTVEWENAAAKRGRGVNGDDEVDTLVRELLGPTATVRNQGQRDAIRLMAVERVDAVVVRLPPAAGKSLVMQATAANARGKVTVVIVPFIALRDELRRRCTELDTPIFSSVWQVEHQAQSSLVFATPETASTTAFARWIVQMETGGRLEAVVVDECHVLSLDPDWRPAMQGVARLLGRLSVRIAIMSGTLPSALLRDIQDRLGGKVRSWRDVTAPVVPANLSLEVEVRPLQSHEAYMRQRLAEASTGRRLLIVVMSLEE
ncbi:MAG: hypothetical protein M1823_006121, partial [Watsoniomyces obsoletus]